MTARLCLLLVGFGWDTGSAGAAELPLERIHWQNTPIPVVLSVGVERPLQFDAPVSVGVPAPLQARVRTQSVDGFVYLRASAPFPPTRVLVRELASGQTYLLDVEATDSPGAGGGRLVITGSAGAWGPEGSASLPASPHGYVALTRFAAQQLFAPLRLATPLECHRT